MLLFTPICAQWGVHLDPAILKYFTVQISVRNLHHTCIHLKQQQISIKTIQKMFRFKMVAKKQIFISQK